MKSFKSISGLTEASILKPDYVSGQKFIYGGGIKELNRYKKGDIFVIVSPTKNFTLIGKENSALEKYLEAPDGKVFLFKGGASTHSTKFTHSKSGGGTPSGAQWESLIVYAYNNLKSEETERDTREIAERFWANYAPISNKIARNFDRALNANKLVQTGGGGIKVSLGKFWRQTGASNKTPKTDIASSDFKEKLSLKKSGGSQLISAQKKEAMSIVLSALSECGTDAKFARPLINSIEKNMTQLVTNETVTSLKRRKKAGDTDADVLDFSKKDEGNKELTDLMSNYLSNNELFRKHIILEAATGNHKFGGSNSKAAANLMGMFDVGSSKVKVAPVRSINDSIVVQYSNKIKPFVAFKKGSASSSAYSSFRITLPKQEINEDLTFTDIIVEELSKVDNSILTEDFLSEGPLDMLKRAREFASKTGKSMVQKVAKVLDVVIKRMKQALSKIVSAGKKMFSMLLKFFGFEISDTRGIVSEISL